MALSWPGGSFSAALELLALCGYYVIAADLVLLLWHVLRRMRQFIVIDLLSTLFALFPVLVHFPFSFKSGDENSQSLTIVSWNVDNFLLERQCLDDLSLKILNEGPDISNWGKGSTFWEFLLNITIDNRIRINLF